MKQVVGFTLLFSALIVGWTEVDAESAPGLVENSVSDGFKHHITKDHVLEELQHQINTKDKKDMSEKELQFHYFKLHDFDNNNFLDGLELVKAIKHSHEEHAGTDGAQGVEEMSEDQIISIIDSVLKEDDYNGDGYVSFHEFMASQAERT